MFISKKKLEKILVRLDKQENEVFAAFEKIHNLCAMLAKYKVGDVLRFRGTSYGRRTISVVCGISVFGGKIRYEMQDGSVVSESLITDKCSCDEDAGGKKRKRKK